MPLIEALNIVITADSAKAEQNLKQLTAATKDLEKLEAAAKRLEPASKRSAEGFAAFQNASAQVAKARDEVGRLGAVAQATGSPINTLKSAFATGLGIGTGIGAITQGVKIVKELGAALIDASKLAEEDARSQFTLTQAIRNNTDAAGAGVRSAESYVQSLQNTAAVADDQLRPALATLVRSTNDVAKAQDLLGLSADVAAGTGRDLGTVADALAKTYQGNTKSLKQLAPEVDKLIKDGASASEVFAKLTEVYAGSAKGLADVSPWQRLNVQVGETKEAVGKSLLPVVSELADVVQRVLPNLVTLGDDIALIGKHAESAVPGLSHVLGLLDKLPDIPSIPNLQKVVPGSQEASDKLDAFGRSVLKTQGGLQDLLPAISALPPATQRMIEKFVGVKAATTAAGDGLEDLATRTKAAQAALSGVSENLFGGARAQTAFNKALQDTNTGNAAGQAKAYESALRRVEDATRSVGDAQKALDETLIQRFVVGLGASSDEVTSAQIAERDSTRSLAEAKLKLIDAQEAVNRLSGGAAAASRLEAQAAFLDAQKALAAAQKTGDPSALLKARAGLLKAQQGLTDTSAAKQAQDLAKAQSAVGAAQDGVTKAAIDQRSAQKDLNDTLLRGKDGSKELADANRQVEDAQRRVEDATRSLDDAQDGVQDALKGTGAAAKTAAEKFDDGLKSADAWITYLATHNGTPKDFAKAIDAIASGLSGVAQQAGETTELDLYIQKIRDLSGLYLGLSTAQLPSTSSSSANAAEEALRRSSESKQQIQVVIDGKVLVDAIVNQSNQQGGLPIKIKATN